MDAGRAHALAERLRRGRRDAGGGRLGEHVRRVAATVAPDARVVAWIHEVLEHTSISEDTLLTACQHASCALSAVHPGCPARRMVTTIRAGTCDPAAVGVAAATPPGRGR